MSELKLPGVRVLKAPYGNCPISPKSTSPMMWCSPGTAPPRASGCPTPPGSPIRQGLTICDATSAAFAQRLDFAKLDVVTFSWQKVLGGEAAHGMLVLSPRAVERLETWRPPWPLPKIFRLTKGGKLDRAIFEGETINTPSMLCVEDWILALEWARSIGGLDALVARADANAGLLHDWADRSPWAAVLAAVKETRSNTSVCLALRDPAKAARPATSPSFLEEEGVAFDIASHRDAPPGLRIWCGATIERADIAALLPWLDYAYRKVTAEGGPSS